MRRRTLRRFLPLVVAVGLWVLLAAAEAGHLRIFVGVGRRRHRIRVTSMLVKGLVRGPMLLWDPGLLMGPAFRSRPRVLGQVRSIRFWSRSVMRYWPLCPRP